MKTFLETSSLDRLTRIPPSTQILVSFFFDSNFSESESPQKNWGFEPQPLHYEYYLVRGSRIPDINPLNPKYRAFVNLWKRLPLALSQRLGPLIARSLG